MAMNYTQMYFRLYSSFSQIPRGTKWPEADCGLPCRGASSFSGGVAPVKSGLTSV